MAITADLIAVSESYRLPDQIFLLLTEPRHGAGPYQVPAAIERALALAVLWELRLAKMVQFHDGREIEIRRSGELDAIYYGHAIRALEATRAPSLASRRAADLVVFALHPIATTIARDLERRGVVHHEIRRRFLLFNQEGWERSESGREAGESLRAAANEVARKANNGDLAGVGALGERRLLGLVMILESLGLLERVITLGTAGRAPAWLAGVGRSLRRHYHGLGLTVAMDDVSEPAADLVEEDFAFFQAVEACSLDWSVGSSVDSHSAGVQNSPSDVVLSEAPSDAAAGSWGGSSDSGSGGDSGSTSSGSD